MSDATSMTSGNLIAAGKVNGTSVFDLAGDKLGTIHDIMIDKMTGNSVYAVMSFGGFLGMGEKFHPLPWAKLKYNDQQGGFVINLDKKLLEDSPSYDTNENFAWTSDYGRKVDTYYG